MPTPISLNFAADFGGNSVTSVALGVNPTDGTNVQNITNALVPYITSVSPTLTGVPLAPTATVGTNTTQIATTAFVLANATGSGAPLSSPAFIGIPTAPTAAVATNTTQIATTAFVLANATGSGAPLASPAFTGVPTAPTASVATNTTQLATTAFVLANAVSTASPTFTGVPLAPTAALATNTTQIATTAFVIANSVSTASPIFTGVPSAPTAAVATNTTQLATTAFVTTALTLYLTTATASTTYATIASLSSYATTASLSAYLTTSAAGTTYAPLASPTLTGTPVAPTAALSTNTTQLATTAFVLANSVSTASPSFTGVPLAPTAALSTNTTQIATTAFVLANAVSTASPTFTGTPSAPTAALATNTTQLATTAFVIANAVSTASPSFTGIPLAPTAALSTNTTQIATTAFVLANSVSTVSPTFTGTPSAPTATAGTNTTQLATTAFVTTALIPYLTTATASTTYLTIATASTTYLTTVLATTTYAPFASPALTGVPTAPTGSGYAGTTQIATMGYVTNSFLKNDGSNQNTTITINRVRSYAVFYNASGASDINYSAGNVINILPSVITANRTITLTIDSNSSNIFIVDNSAGTSAFTWSYVTALKDARGNSITTIPNNSTHWIYNDGTVFHLISTSNVRYKALSTITFASAITPNFAGSDVQKLILTANTTISAPINLLAGEYVRLVITNGATPFTVTFTGYIASGSLAVPTVTPTANAVDYFTIFNDGTNYVLTTLTASAAGGGAPLASPAFTGVPTAPTAALSTNTTQLATTAFVLANAVSTVSPTFTGVPLAPTATVGTNTTQIATTAFVLANAVSTTSPAFTGIPTAPTATVGTNTTQLATTAFVISSIAPYLTTAIAATTYAPLASPVLTGVPVGPTAAVATNTTQLATTAFVIANAVSTVSPTFTGVPLAPTATAGTNTTQIATTAFVVTSLTPYALTSSLSVYLTTATAGTTYAPLASPALTGVPTAPTAAVATNTVQIATTAFVLANAVSTVSPAFTGIPTAPTATAGTNTTQLSTTAFVVAAVAPYLTTAIAATTYAPLASPSLTGIPVAPTATAGTNTTQLATTAFVVAAVAPYLTTAIAGTTYAPIASPSLTGIPLAPTAAVATNTTQIATTAFVIANAVSTVSPAFTGTPTAPTAAAATSTTQIATTAFVTTALAFYLTTAIATTTYAPLASPTLTGIPLAPTATVGTNTTQLATTAFVTAAVAPYLTTAIAATTYAPLASPTLTGVPLAPTAAAATSTTQIATTAFVTTALASYLTTASASSTYLTIATASTTYLTVSTAVTGVLTGYAAGTTYTAVLATDTILSAFNKTAGNFLKNDNSLQAGGLNTSGVIATSSVTTKALVLTYSLATDANYAVTPGYGGIILPVITANRTFTFPTTVVSNFFMITNQNTSAFTWTLVTPIIGVRGTTITIFPNSTTMYLWYDGTNWRAFSNSALRQRYISSLTYAATLTPNFSSTDIFQLPLSGNTTISVPTGMVAGDTCTLQVTQSGNFTVTWSGYKMQGGFTLLNSLGSGKIDIFSIFYDGTNYYLTASNLNATAPAKVKAGNMSYKKTYWSALTDFTQVGSVAPTIVNGSIRFASGTNDYNNYLTINGTQNADQNLDLEIHYRVVVVPAASTLTGIGIGRTSINAFSSFKTSTAVIDLIGYGNAMIVATNLAIAGNIGATAYTTLPAVGDMCRIKYSQRGNLIFGVYENFTKTLKVLFNYFIPFVLSGPTIQLPNTSNIAIYNIGGSVDIMSIEVSSQTPMNPYLLAIGDSKTMGFGSVSPAVSFANSINQLGLTDVWAGGADNTAEILASIPNAIKLNPTYVLLCIGRNDIANAIAAATYQANYIAIVNALVAAGITVIHLTPIPETTVSQTVLDTFVRSQYPGQFIDSSVGWVNATHLGSDGTHPNVDGHRFLSSLIVSSGLIPTSGVMSKILSLHEPVIPVGFV
ncbi:MAG: GDSL lipase and tail fiber [Cryophage ML09]|nr:MAG: GDSL lipase and tail fiber [Cryophage ML09]